MQTSPFLDLPGAVPATGSDVRVAAHYGDPVREQRAWLAGRGVADFGNLAVVRVTGPDRLTWLHALTTQDLASLAPGESREALILDPHGHIEHAFGVLDDGESTALLVADQASDALLEHLRAMVFRSRVEVSRDEGVVLAATRSAPSDAPWPVWRDPWPGPVAGATRYGPPAEQHPGRDWGLAVALLPAAEAAQLIAARLDAGDSPVGMAAIDALRIAAWRPRSRRELDERTLPAELDWVRTAVHLDKGCYRGQETVAKIHNVGKPPRRLVQLQLDGSGHELPAPGTSVLHDGDAVGRVTSAGRHLEQGPIALAVVRRTLPLTADLVVAEPGGEPVAARQEQIVPVSGEDADRPTITRPARRPTLL